MQGISERLDDSDYVLNLQLTHPSSPSEKTRRYLLGGNVDGAIVVSHHSGDHFLASLGRSLPVVFGGRPLGQIANPGDYYIDVDNRLGARHGVEHLIERGRRRIATITGPADMPAAVDRELGWRDAVLAAGLSDTRIARGDFTEAGGIRAALTLVDEHPDLDAIFVASDLMASGVLLALAERGLRVPEDVAVVGFDNSPYATRGRIGLTTVAQPSLEMGVVMADTLLRLLAGEQVEHVTMMETEPRRARLHLTPRGRRVAGSPSSGRAVTRRVAASARRQTRVRLGAATRRGSRASAAVAGGVGA